MALTAIVVAGSFPSSAQAKAHQWRSLLGRHFSVSFDQSTEDIAEKALGIAEATAEQLEAYFGWRQGPDRISIVLSDDDDFSNGYSMGRTPLVRIYCRKTPLDWRGETVWLETVLSHELSHVYTLMQMQRSFGISVGFWQHDDANREDVQLQASWDVDDLPHWFVEGVAQVGSQAFKADGRDPWREALLADAYRTGRILSLDRMGRFEGTSRESELAYNQGFDLVLFLQARHPNADFRALCRRVGQDGFDGAMRRTYGRSMSELYREWYESLADRFPPLPPADSASFLFKGRQGPLVAETGASGSYAVANWKHDGLRYDLFEVDAKGDRDRVARDVGEKVVVDPATGDAWYAAMSLNTQTNSEQFDIFRRRRDGATSRETNGARSIAFDAAKGVLVYARYQAGVTDLVRRNLSSGAEKVLRRFPRDTAVYDLSIATPDSVYLTLGTGNAVRAGILASESLRVLWPEGPSVLSVAALGADTLVMVAVDSGAPRLVWSIGEGPWHRIGEPDATRAVWVDRAGRRILSSAYRDGDFRIRTVVPDFADTARSVEVAKVKPVTRREWNPGRTFDMAPSWIRMPVYFELGYGLTGRKDKMDTASSGAFQAFVSENLMDPTESWGVGGRAGSILFPTGAKMPKALPAASLWWWHQDGSRLLELGYSYRENGQVVEDVDVTTTYTMGSHSFQASIDAAVTNELSTRWEASYNWATQSARQVASNGATMQSRSTKVFSLMQGGAGLGFGRSDSRLDPAGIGSPGFQGQLQGNIFQAQVLQDIVYNEEIWRNPSAYFDGMVSIAGRTWLLQDLASLTGKLDGYGTIGGIDSIFVLPGSTGSMGGTGAFRGYSDDFLDLRAFGRGTLELRMSPFASRSAKVSWSDRTRIAVRLEAGQIQYLSRIDGYSPMGVAAAGFEEKSTLAASWDLALRQGFMLGNNRASSLELGFAMPLLSIANGRRDDPYRLFFGLQLN